MGLFSKSSSSSSSTEVDTTSAGAQDESTAISIGEGATANFLDAGAVNKALDFAGSALEKAFSSAGQVAAIGGTAQKEANSRVGEAQSGGAQRVLYLAFAALAVFAFMKRG